MRNLLKYLGITPNYKGYEYIKTAVDIIQNNPEARFNICKDIYHVVAELHGEEDIVAGGKRVERAIRHAIEISWNTTDLWYELFPMAKNKKPTNAHFLCELAEELKLAKVS